MAFGACKIHRMWVQGLLSYLWLIYISGGALPDGLATWHQDTKLRDLFEQQSAGTKQQEQNAKQLVYKSS